MVIIDHKNQIVKELANGTVPIEFGEYTIRLRNRNNKRAICKLSIDGENMLDGGVIIPANGFVDIERPTNSTKRFKFVSLDSNEAYEFGKDGPNHDKVKGTIVAEFALEKDTHVYTLKRWDDLNWWPDKVYRPYCGSTFRGMSAPATYSATVNNVSHQSLDTDCFSDKSMGLQDGATVEGSESSQRYSSCVFNDDGNWVTLRLFLQGYEAPQIVQKAKSIKYINDCDQEIEVLQKRIEELKKEKIKKELTKQIEALEKEISSA